MIRGDKIIVFVLILFVSGLFIQSSHYIEEKQNNNILEANIRPPFLSDSSKWVDSLIQAMPLREKIAQSIMVPVYPERGENEKKRIEKIIKDEKVGGIIMFQSESPKIVYEWVKHFQSISELPLLVSIDAEWGLSMRFDSSVVYQRQMAYGAIHNNDLIYEMGLNIGEQLKYLGININFAPVVDVNNNPNNPVINSRSFGEDKLNVAEKGIAYMNGLQEAGVIAVAKHFPGHGDTDTDSHVSLPVIKHDKNRLDSIELFPFKALINNGVGGVMMAHMHIPSLDSTPGLPSTLSAEIADSLLSKRLNFNGLVFTDAMNMGGVSNTFKPINANIMAYKAGNDILLMPAEVTKSIDAIKRLAKKGEIDTASVNLKLKKILQSKYWLNYEMDSVYNYKQLHQDKYYVNLQKLAEASITAVQNNGVLPMKKHDSLKIVSVQLGATRGSIFQQSIGNHYKVDNFRLNTSTLHKDFIELQKAIDNYNLVIISLHTDDNRAYKLYGFNTAQFRIINRIRELKKTVLVNFSNPYLLSHIENIKSYDAVIQANTNDSITQYNTAQALFGTQTINGKIPVGINGNYASGRGVKIEALNILKYASAAEAGIKTDSLYKIDSIINIAIGNRAMPGCQVLAARNGKIFFNKSYGHFTYKDKVPVTANTIYDVASITKVAATLPVLMHMYETGEIDIKAPLSDYLQELDTTNKAKLKINDILLHQAGLVSWIPFYRNIIEPIYPEHELFKSKYSATYPIRMGKHSYMNKHIRYKAGYVSNEPDSVYTIKVADNVFVSEAWRDSLFYKILASEVDEKPTYKYSDLGFYLFNWMIEEQMNQTLDKVADSLFYSKLQAYNTSYLPQKAFGLNRIAPTENDLYFRKQVVKGFVHDPGAALLGGVSGHAGLFSTATDMAKLFQMYLNGGNYAGEQFLEKETIDYFTKAHALKKDNRRGLGFDKPHPDTTVVTSVCESASLSSFGHTGFTGTIAWADPETGLIYIFLSNRVYPDASDNKLAQMNIRTDVQELFYQAVKE